MYEQLLTQFGPLGAALVIVLGIAWAAYKKVIKPQQDEAREDRQKYQESLEKTIENHRQIFEQYGESEREIIATMKEFNGNLATHHEKMKSDHRLLIDRSRQVLERKNRSRKK